MEHFSEQVWADFVRETGSAEKQQEIESHLAAGCKTCVTTADLWKQVHNLTAREHAYVPPANAVRMVKLEFEAAQRCAVTAKVVFDTTLQPAAAGVRSVTAAARQMVYEADGLTVDLRFDQCPQSNRVQLIGQVLDKRTTRTSVSDVLIVLGTEAWPRMVETRTNEFGEFNLEFAAHQHLTLSIQAEKTLIRVPLANVKPIRNLNEITDGQ